MKTTADFKRAIELALNEITQPSGKRILKLLANETRAATGCIASVCAVGNVSDAVIRIQPILNRYGLCIQNRLPTEKRTNRFGGRTMAHVWELCLLEVAE